MRLRQYDPNGKSISPLVNIVAKTIINEDLINILIRYLTFFYWHCYMSVTSNDDLSNLSSEGDDGYAKLQWIDNANDTQLIATSAITETKIID